MSNDESLIESSRASFQEKAFITFLMSGCEAKREDFIKRDSQGFYTFEGLETLWIGWKWCYEICKTPVK